MRPTRERPDLMVYVRAFAVFARNPTVIVLPLLAGVIQVLVEQVSSTTGGGGFLDSILAFMLLLLQLFALGVSIVIGDMGWRRGRVSFDDAWQDARNKGRDILFAAFGITFVVSIAQYAGTIIGGIGIILMALAVYGVIFALPAASIGGIPGGAAISVSVERVRSAPLAAAVLTVVTLICLFYLGTFFEQWLFTVTAMSSPLIALLIGALVRSILAGYVAIVTAKVYNDVSFTMPRW